MKSQWKFSLQSKCKFSRLTYTYACKCKRPYDTTPEFPLVQADSFLRNAGEQTRRHQTLWKTWCCFLCADDVEHIHKFNISSVKRNDTYFEIELGSLVCIKFNNFRILYFRILRNSQTFAWHFCVSGTQQSCGVFMWLKTTLNLLAELPVTTWSTFYFMLFNWTNDIFIWTRHWQCGLKLICTERFFQNFFGHCKNFPDNWFCRNNLNILWYRKLRYLYVSEKIRVGSRLPVDWFDWSPQGVQIPMDR